MQYKIFFFFFAYLPSPNLGLIPPGTYKPNARGSDACGGEQQSLDQNTRQIHKGEPPWMCGQHIARASAEDNTGQNTDKGHTLNPRTEIKIPNRAGNRTRVAGTLPTTPRRRVIQNQNIIFQNLSLENVQISGNNVNKFKRYSRRNWTQRKSGK